MLEIHAAYLNLLDQASSDPELCGQFLMKGGAGMTKEQAIALDVSLLSVSSVLSFRGIALGRQSPVHAEIATEDDLADAFDLWTLTKTSDDAEVEAMSNTDWKSDSYCSGFRDYFTYFYEVRSPLNDRVIRYLHATLDVE